MDPVSLEHEELSPRRAGELLTTHADAIVKAACGRVADGRVLVRRNAALVLSLLDPLPELALARLDVARKDEDAIVRRHAISAYASSGVPADRAADALVRALDDDDDGVGQLAIDGLERILSRAGVAIWRRVVEGLADASPFVLMRATPLFERLGEPAVITLTATIAHPHAALRRWARETLQSFGARAVPTLLEALARPALREAATRTLEGLDGFDDSHLERMAGLLGGADAELQAAAFRVLAAMQKAFARRKQRPADVPHPEFYVRSLTERQLAQATQGVSAEALLWNLRDGRWYVRTNSVTLMALVAQPSDPRDLLEAALRPLARDGEADVRLATARAAARVLGPAAAPLLLEASVDADPKVAAEARRQLLALAPRAIRALAAALGAARTEAEVEQGLTALAAAGDAALPVLAEVARRGPAPPARAAAVAGLVRLGARTGPGREALIAALTDADERVRAAAAQGLGALFRDDDEVLQALRGQVGRERSAGARQAAALAADRVAGREPPPKVKAAARLPSASFGAQRLSFADLERAAAAGAVEALSLDALRALTTDGRAEVRHNTALALGLHPIAAEDDELVRWLVLSLKDGALEVRAAAARTIARLKPLPMSVLPPMGIALVDAQGEVEAALLDALVAYGRGALGPLLDALAERFALTADDIARVAAHLPTGLVRAVSQYLHRPARYAVRGLAADLLAAMGPRAAESWQDLSDAVEEPLGTLRGKVVRAIGRCAKPSVDVYEALLVVGNYDNRASVKVAVEEAIDQLVARLEPDTVAAVGGREGQKEAWLRAITQSSARVQR